MEHYEELARVGKALASPVRLRLLDLLRQGPRSVDVLATQAGLEVANVSQHLQQLRAARLVASDKDGQRVVYRLASAEVEGLFVALRGFGETVLPAFDRVKTTLQTLSEDQRGALLGRIARGEVTVLDVRPVEEWRAGHLLDAVHIPLTELPARVAELPKRRDVVAYCRGPYCPMALSAVEILRVAGYRADHLDLGPADLFAHVAGTAVASATLRPRPRATSPTTPRVLARSAKSPRAKSRKRSPA
jgi:DNA-binding transcriptional ArsR family regulator/rhodanese-related sulfurtransferase